MARKKKEVEAVVETPVNTDEKPGMSETPDVNHDDSTEKPEVKPQPDYPVAEDPEKNPDLKEAITKYMEEMNRLGFNTISIAIRAQRKFNLKISPIKLASGGRFSSMLDTVHRMDLEKVAP